MAPVSVRRVLISESVDPCCKTILQENGIEVTEKPQMTKEELIAEIQVSDSSDSLKFCTGISSALIWIAAKLMASSNAATVKMINY